MEAFGQVCAVLAVKFFSALVAAGFVMMTTHNADLVAVSAAVVFLG